MDNDWNAMLEQVAKMNQQALTAATEFNKIATRTQARLARAQLQALETCLEAGTAQLGLVSEARDPKDLVEAQVQVATSFGEKMVTTAQESLDIHVQARNELARWFEQSYSSVQGNLQDAVPEAVDRPATRSTARRSSKKAA